MGQWRGVDGEWSGGTYASSTSSIVVDEFFFEGASLRYCTAVDIKRITLQGAVY